MRNFSLLFLTIAFCFYFSLSFSQPPLPQRTLTVTATQSINFGSFCMSGADGTITVTWQGIRTSTGGVIIIPRSVAQPAIFEIKLCQGRNVIIAFEPTTILTNSEGGPSLTLDVGPTEKGGNGAFFPSNSDCNFVTPLRVGGTLHVPASAAPGSYSGSFNIIFSQE